MSVVSSHVSSLSSILKASGVRSSLSSRQKKICFKLPKDVKSVITDFENGSRQQYQEMVCILRDTNVKDTELLELIKDLQKCIPMLGSEHKNLIEVLFNINWTDRSSEITKAFKRFVEELVCVHIHHSKLIFDKLIYQFRSTDQGAAVWENGQCPDSHKLKISHIHDLLGKFLKIIPMSANILMQSFTESFPYSSEGTVVTERYLFALFQVIEYAPQLRRDILFLIINKLSALDVNCPPSEIQYYEENMDEDMEEDGAIFELEDDEKNHKLLKKEMKHPDAQKLDVCMDQLFTYIYNCCFTDEHLQIESLKYLYHDLLHIFEKIILPTHASSHIQFIMFYLCSFKSTVIEAFIKWLWQKVSTPSVAPVIRQSSISYIVSLLARANFVSIRLILDLISVMCDWIHSYINSQDGMECINSDVRIHSVFYAVCQALFYLLAFRHNDIIKGRKSLIFLQSLNLNKIVACRLNPLRVCQPAIVQKFSALTRNYQLAYCYTIIERNARNNLPIILHNRNPIVLETFFPFDPYLLQSSGKRILPLYNTSETCTLPSDIIPTKFSLDCDNDDFMDESILNRESANYEKFSYSTSPGFMAYS